MHERVNHILNLYRLTNSVTHSLKIIFIERKTAVQERCDAESNQVLNFAFAFEYIFTNRVNPYEVRAT